MSAVKRGKKEQASRASSENKDEEIAELLLAFADGDITGDVSVSRPPSSSEQENLPLTSSYELPYLPQSNPAVYWDSDSPQERGKTNWCDPLLPPQAVISLNGKRPAKQCDARENGKMKNATVHNQSLLGSKPCNSCPQLASKYSLLIKKFETKHVENNVLKQQIILKDEHIRRLSTYIIQNIFGGDNGQLPPTATIDLEATNGGNGKKRKLESVRGVTKQPGTYSATLSSSITNKDEWKGIAGQVKSGSSPKVPTASLGLDSSSRTLPNNKATSVVVSTMNSTLSKAQNPVAVLEQLGLSLSGPGTTFPYGRSANNTKLRPRPRKITYNGVFHLTFRELGNILKKVNHRTTGCHRIKARRQENVCTYFRTQRNDCIEVVVEGSTCRLPPLTITRIGMKVTPTGEVQMSHDEMGKVLHFLGRNVSDGEDRDCRVVQLSRLFDEEHEGGFAIFAIV